MAREIAVFLDNQDRTASLGEPGRVCVYRRWQKTWTMTREQDFALTATDGLKGLRRQMIELLAFLGDCRIFVGKSLSGVPYYELEKAGFSLWEQSGEPLNYLEVVWAREEAGRAEAERPELTAVFVAPSPIEKAPGHYYISLKDVQTKNSSVTSKQVLQPFLRQRRFAMLEVICDHLPPWLEMELQAGAFVWTSEKVNEREIRVVIKK